MTDQQDARHRTDEPAPLPRRSPLLQRRRPARGVDLLPPRAEPRPDRVGPRLDRRDRQHPRALSPPLPRDPPRAPRVRLLRALPGHVPPPDRELRAASTTGSPGPTRTSSWRVPPAIAPTTSTSSKRTTPASTGFEFHNFNFWCTDEDDPAIPRATRRVRHYSLWPDCPPRIRSWRARVTNIRHFNHNPLDGTLRRAPSIFATTRCARRRRCGLASCATARGFAADDLNFHYENMGHRLESLQIPAAALHFDDGVARPRPGARSSTGARSTVARRSCADLAPRRRATRSTGRDRGVLRDVRLAVPLGQERSVGELAKSRQLVIQGDVFELVLLAE